MEAKIRYARTSDGVDIAYAVHGLGPLLLVARPLLREAVDGDLRWFDPHLPVLAERRAVAVWDWRGMGLSSTVDAEYTVQSTVRDIEAVAQALAAPQFDLMAYMTPCHSAVAFAAAHRGRVRRLVLANPSAPGGSPRTGTLRDIPDLAATNFAAYIQLAALRIYGWDRAEAAKRWERHMTSHFDAARWLHLMDQMEQLDADSQLSSVEAPTLVIQYLTEGSQRLVGPPRRQQIASIAAALPRGQLAIINPDGGRTYVDAVEEFLSAGDSAASDEPPAGTAIIFFADIVDSTALTERLGDAAFRDKARELDDALRAIISERGGKAIDGFLSGDGVLATFPAASQAIDAALKCGAAGEAQGLPLHLGLHAGDVIREQNNVFGGAVNIASRISGLSAPGEVLVSDIVRGLARTSAGVTFEDRGEQSLKGIGEPVRVFAVRREGG